MAGPILEAQSITKRYPGVVALRDVSFQLRGGADVGEVHALCGENGAGKSTLIKVLGGVLSHDTYEGQLLCDGKPVRFESIRDAEAAGIAVIHQELALVDEMTVAENVFLGNEPARFGFVQHDRMYVETQKVLERFKLDIDPTARVRELGMGRKQLVEIARALAKRARILILDEPTSALSDKEVRTLLAIILDLRGQGVSSIYISHKLDEVFHLADRITVLRDGQSVFSTPSRETDEPSLVQHMVGRRVDDLFPPRRAVSGGASSSAEVLLSVQGLNVAPRAGEPARLRDISFDVRGGQVLGIGGLMGAGRSELLMHLFGCYGERLSGTVTFGGRPLPENDPAGNVRAGLVLVTEDRKRYGLCLDAMVGFNLSLSSLRELSRRGFIDGARELQENRRMVDAMRVKTASLEVKVGTLSGGNQQKVVLGRALMTGPKVVLLDEPTRGIDIGAKSEIYALVRELTDRGLGVVLVSSELPELIGLADSILMLSEGQLGGSFDAREATQAGLLSAAMSKGRASRANEALSNEALSNEALSNEALSNEALSNEDVR
jgi:D-xylose transport system ATP-binding protein